MNRKLVGILSLSMILGGCSTVTIQPQQIAKVTLAPTYQQTEHFFFWGLAGEKNVDVKTICAGKPVKQMQTQQTFLNGLAAIVTLGVYAPHSVKVWCD